MPPQRGRLPPQPWCDLSIHFLLSMLSPLKIQSFESQDTELRIMEILNSATAKIVLKVLVLRQQGRCAEHARNWQKDSDADKSAWMQPLVTQCFGLTFARKGIRALIHARSTYQY